MVEQARLEQLDTGLAPVTDGWFVVSVPEAAWLTSEAFGAACIIESDDVSFPHIGYTIHVLQPGMPNGMYHREAAQEDFLVLSGECLRWSRARNGASRRGTSCTARRTPSTSSSAPATARA